jgi:protein-L-isoaspartate O-methyltransferase
LLKALQCLFDFVSGCKALDVGSGSGYLAAVMARMVTRGEGHGHVVGIEVVPELVEWANKNVENDPGAKRRMEDGKIAWYTVPVAFEYVTCNGTKHG